MNTTCVDRLDPPVRTLDDLARDAKALAQYAAMVWKGSKTRMAKGKARPCASRLNRVMSMCEGDKHRAAKYLGISILTLNNWLRDVGISHQWAADFRKPIYCEDGRRWECSSDAAMSLHVSSAAVRMAIYQNGRIRRAGVRVAYKPFPGVTYTARSA